MEVTYPDIQEALNEYGVQKYYVYRLVDPRTLQTFYVGKGCGDRVFQHVNDVKSLISQNGDEDEFSLKSQTIAEILGSGKKVISIIHRRGLTEDEAFEVEAALIDAYPGLTNIQNGHDYDRGAITVEDLYELAGTKEYSEPKDDYIIIKTSLNAINNNGSLYDATRICWCASLGKAQNYKYVFAVINGVVQEVYKVNSWDPYPYNNSNRIAFDGKPATDHMAAFKKQLIPEKYRKKGVANPFLYKK